MDDRESLYFDTISLADSEAAAAAAAHRKSLSQSRNTIYHSAVDLAGDETPSRRTGSMRENGHRARSSWNPNYRHSTPLEQYFPSNMNGTIAGVAGGGGGGGGGVGNIPVGVDYTDGVLAAQVMALQNGRATNNYSAVNNGIGGIGETSLQMANHDLEVSRRLLQNSTQTNRDKKLPITYSQWKFRVKIFQQTEICF